MRREIDKKKVEEKFRSLKRKRDELHNCKQLLNSLKLDLQVLNPCARHNLKLDLQNFNNQLFKFINNWILYL